MNKKLLHSFFIFFSLSVSVQAQDIHFSQFYETTVLRNPALCGIFSGDYKVAANYRSQWNSISKPFVTAQLSFEGRIPVNSESDDFFSVGLLGLYDKAGSIDMKTTAIYPAVNFSKKLENGKNSYLTTGFTAGYLQRSLDPSKMTTNSQYQSGGFDPNAGTRENVTTAKLNYFDLGVGVNYSSSSGENEELTYFFGVSGYHFTRPQTSFYNDAFVRLNMKWNVNAGFNYRIDENYGFLMQGNFAKQGVYSELILGGLLVWKKGGENEVHQPDFILYGGLFYRFKDAVIPTLKLDYKGYSFGLSYDVNVSKLKTASNLRGGTELTLVRTGVFNDPKFKQSRTSCPRYTW
ncbi:MAG TPA: PorP/SprF family type IX secretion system membrane protein [Flavipsychrobacter sp.]|nr:PorP/SprF family type IX secretion system membrane protein [Flavipsychrobacter sp.]